MIRNFIKIAIRNILRDRYYTAINVFGLGVGLACAMVVILFVRHEFNYEKSFSDSEKIYRLSTKFFGIGDFAGASPVLASELKEKPWVEEATRVVVMGPATAKYNQTQVHIGRIAMADSSFFKVFNYPFVEGHSRHVLNKPNTLVISKAVAAKIFGDQPALGKVLTLDGQPDNFEIVGVFDDSGMLTHLKNDIYMSHNVVDYDNPWWSVGPLTYVKLGKQLSKIEVEQHMKDFTEKSIFPKVVSNTDTKFENWYTGERGYGFYVYPLKDIYFDAKLKFEPFAGGNLDNIIIFSVIGLMIVAIASINYINLATAQGMRRATEVGIRKTLGSGRIELVAQFLTESVLIVFIAGILAMGLTELLIIVGSNLAGSQLGIGVFLEKENIIILSLFIVLVGVFSAIYPALYLSRFSPGRVLKGNYVSGKPGILRNLLVVGQFTISMALVVCSLVIYQQLNFMKQKDLGFDQENSLIIKNLDNISTPDELRGELLNLSSVEAVSITDRTPGDQNTGVYSITEAGVTYNFEHMATDADLVPILNLMMIEGRNFDRQRIADTASVILNQKAVELLGYDDPVGKIFDEKYTIIGVVSDFHFKSLKSQIEPLIIFNRHTSEGVMLVKLGQEADVQRLLKSIGGLWSKHNPEATFDYSFLDENYARMAEKEENIAKAISLLTGVAIIISLLGLAGLCSYTVERKTKEIGIRKVLGASWQNIIMLLGSQFTRLILLAFVISVPVAWYFSDLWLANFAYRINPGAEVYIIGAILAIIPTWLLISFQSLGAAKANPVDSLRDD
ncbi:ABC transporter permease [Fulvivirga kasyanovii]|uniref:ABC transporter permease n=1 Tax=Fulvivirga kasyanovii TaxID=396812 RepID=A0ABW9RU03_9BACT|nr:ABC transporter permease [Fulvivirga kasyanovii]MTI27684.1 ABC transporter permease [Fulvivirga kasyanovii]